MGRPGTPSLLREINDRAALELLLAEGPLTRARVGEGTGLSKVTASQTLTRLEERGLVAVTGQQAGGRGPSAAVYAIVPSTGIVAGLDVAPPCRSSAIVEDHTDVPAAGLAAQKLPKPCVGNTGVCPGSSDASRPAEACWAAASARVCRAPSRSGRPVDLCSIDPPVKTPATSLPASTT